jgi:hypothetical protein
MPGLSSCTSQVGDANIAPPLEIGSAKNVSATSRTRRYQHANTAEAARVRRLTDLAQDGAPVPAQDDETELVLLISHDRHLGVGNAHLFALDLGCLPMGCD